MHFFVFSSTWFIFGVKLGYEKLTILVKTPTSYFATGLSYSPLKARKLRDSRTFIGPLLTSGARYEDGVFTKIVSFSYPNFKPKMNQVLEKTKKCILLTCCALLDHLCSYSTFCEFVFTFHKCKYLTIMIWNKVPKTKFLNLYRVRYGASAAIAEFNEGQAAALAQHSVLSLSPGTVSREIMKKKNQTRAANICKKEGANTAARIKKKRDAKAASDAINIDAKLLNYGPGKY
jgi:hypothetical protein